MKKNWWIILILLVVGGLWYRFAYKIPPVQYVKMLNGKGSYEVKTQKVKYFEQAEGFLAKPTKPGIYPGVVMIHDSWGLNDNIRDLAKLLSSFGYYVLAVDLYNGTVAKTAEEAQKQIGSLDQEKAILNMRAAANYLRKNENSAGGSSSEQFRPFIETGIFCQDTYIYIGSAVREIRGLRIVAKR